MAFGDLLHIGLGMFMHEVVDRSTLAALIFFPWDFILFNKKDKSAYFCLLVVLC